VLPGVVFATQRVLVHRLTSAAAHMHIAQHHNMPWSDRTLRARSSLYGAYMSPIMVQLSALVFPMAPSQYVFKPLESTNSLMR
jgi:hypothetical protein